MPWAKGQSGNPSGAKPGQGKQSKAIDRLIKRGSVRGLKYLNSVADGTEEASVGDRTRVSMYLVDRDLGKPEQAQSQAGGMFQGATIMVNTGIRRGVEPPTIDSTGRLEGEDTPEQD